MTKNTYFQKLRWRKLKQEPIIVFFKRILSSKFKNKVDRPQYVTPICSDSDDKKAKKQV
jgi:hypothetical protein